MWWKCKKRIVVFFMIQVIYNERIVFNNTNGEEIVTEKNNFVHYTNESVSALQKGVILNLEEIDKDPIVYYNRSNTRTNRYNNKQ